jgi:outer membrane protein TolC
MRLSLLALAIPLALRAQSPQTLTLQDAISMAQRQGPAAQIARSQRDAARWRDRAFNSRLMPQLFLRGDAANLNHGINQVPQPDGSTLFLGQSQNVSSFQLGFDQRIPLTGGTISIGSAITRFDQFSSENTKYWQTSPVVVTLQQDLFKPRAIVWDERIQSLSASVAERGYLEAREDVAGNTADAFFNLYAQQMTLANATANVAVNDTLYTLNKGRFEVGKIGENELLQSELQLLRARASVDGAKLERDRSESALRRLINVHSPDTLVVIPPQDVPTVDVDPEKAVAQALRNASITEQASLDSVNARRQETEARLGNGFAATLQASYGMNQTSNLFGLAYASPLPRQTLSMQVSMPVFQWGGGRADVQAARANAAQISSLTRARREQLIEDARYAALQLTQSQRMLTIAAKADTVAEKRFEVAKNRYVIGKIGVSDLYIAQNEKDQALDAYVQALRSYWANYYRLRRVTLYDFAEKTSLQ